MGADVKSLVSLILSTYRASSVARESDKDATRMASERADILHGYAAIGQYLGMTSDAARFRVAREKIPVVHSGRRVWIRKATLDEWIAKQEQSAQANSGLSTEGR